MAATLILVLVIIVVGCKNKSPSVEKNQPVVTSKQISSYTPREIDNMLRHIEERKVTLITEYPGNKVHIYNKVSEDDLHILVGFFKKKLYYKSRRNRKMPLKNTISKLYKTISAAFIAGADQLLMNIFLKGGRGLKYAKELALSKNEILQALDIADKVLKQSKRFGSLGTEIPKCLFNDNTYNYLDIGTECSAAIDFFVIGPSGHIRVCNHSQINICNYKDIDKLKANIYWQKFAQKDYLPNECYSCNDFGKCDGGCREEAHIINGSINALHELL